jgi:replicative DNA helicase
MRKIEPRKSVESLIQRVDTQPPGAPNPDTVPTGFPSVDRALGGGLRRRDLIVLGGDVGAGKSALALGFAIRAAQAGESVAVVSGEMDEERLMERAIALEGRVQVDQIRTAKVDEVSRAGMGAAAVRLRGLPLKVVPLAADSFDEMTDRLDAIRDLSLVVVDYLQLVPPPSRTRRATHDEEVLVALRSLKALALEKRVALLVLSQLPGLPPDRKDRRPTLDDFGALGAVKQIADVILGIYREEMYRPDGGVEGATELIIAKNRNGPTGFVDLYFYRKWMRFEDMLDPDR